MFYILLSCIFFTLFISILYIKLFTDKNKINNVEMFKNVGSSGIAETEVSLLFGVVSFKNDLNENKKIVCYSYREKIKKGERVLITDYDIHKEMYIIDEYPHIK